MSSRVYVFHKIRGRILYNCRFSHLMIEEIHLGKYIFQHSDNFNPSMASDYIHYTMWDEITYPSQNFNGTTAEVWEWISNVIPHFTGRVITYPCWNKSESVLVKGAPCDNHFETKSWHNTLRLSRSHTVLIFIHCYWLPAFRSSNGG